MSVDVFKSIDRDEVENWCKTMFGSCEIIRLTEILTGEYSLKEAREDILSFRGTKYGLQRHLAPTSDDKE